MVNLKGKHSKTKQKLQNPEERERERGRESFTVKLKPTPPLHHHNRPMLPTTKSKPSQKPKSKHKPPWDLYPSNPRPMTSCYSRPHDYLRPHKPNTTHIPTHPKPILRERERERERELHLMISVAWFDDRCGVDWNSETQKGESEKLREWGGLRWDRWAEMAKDKKVRVRSWESEVKERETNLKY